MVGRLSSAARTISAGASSARLICRGAATDHPRNAIGAGSRSVGAGEWEAME